MYSNHHYRHDHHHQLTGHVRLVRNCKLWADPDFRGECDRGLHVLWVFAPCIHLVRKWQLIVSFNLALGIKYRPRQHTYQYRPRQHHYLHDVFN